MRPDVLPRVFPPFLVALPRFPPGRRPVGVLPTGPSPYPQFPSVPTILSPSSICHSLELRTARLGQIKGASPQSGFGPLHGRCARLSRPDPSSSSCRCPDLQHSATTPDTMSDLRRLQRLGGLSPAGLAGSAGFRSWGEECSRRREDRGDGRDVKGTQGLGGGTGMDSIEPGCEKRGADGRVLTHKNIARLRPALQLAVFHTPFAQPIHRLPPLPAARPRAAS